MGQTQQDMDALRAWLATCPHFGDSPAEILPKALEEVSRQEDLLGNALVGYRYSVSLIWQKPGQGDALADARGLLDFQRWVSVQQSAGLAPRFGQVPDCERLSLEKCGMTLGARTVTYTATLLADFLQLHDVSQ